MAFRCQRWTVANVLPVAFMLAMISIIWSLYLCLHLLTLLEADASRPPVGCETSYVTAQVVGLTTGKGHISAAMVECIQAARSRGIIEFAIQQSLTLLLLICFARAVFTDPGSVPNEPEWLPESHSCKRGPEEIGIRADGVAGDAGKRKLPKSHEVKHTGARRFCKWCNRFKPDRSHHCRVCRSCILKMDHHCPWIANCVGFRNHKYFFLLVLYSLLDCMFVVVTMSESLYMSLVEEMPFFHRFFLVFAMTLSVMMGVLLMMFFMFHTWLMLRATTTIEFCEKTYRHSGGSHRGVSSIYDRTLMENVKAVLGPSILLWLLPVSPPEGDGLSFKVSEEIDSSSEDAPLLSKYRTGGSSSSAGPLNVSQGGVSVSAPTGASSFNKDMHGDNGSAGDLVPSTPQSHAVSGIADEVACVAVVDTAVPPEITGAQQSIS